MPPNTHKPEERIYTGLSRAAEFANVRSASTSATPSPKPSPPQCMATPPGHWVTLFFDGTGNNLEADSRTGEHSNVARLYRSHRQHDEKQGIFPYYVPGIGTYFRDIGDPGNEATGNGAGGRGAGRLEWAMKQLDDRIRRSGGHTLHLALFGFSRGAALARAFALRVAKRCVRGEEEGTWLIKLGARQYPLRLYFMGLFDTVASVGVPMGANNANFLVSGLGSTRLALWDRGRTDLYRLAFGDSPGADPAPGLANGHMDWADDLTIPELVEDCLHMMAAHELRNSFPVDSVLQGRSYAPNCREMVYPGAHSDVGGGYRPGEGARSRTHGSLLSMIPLRTMHAEALRAGVPLAPTSATPKEFAEDPANKRDFDTLCRRFNAYMKLAGSGRVPLGTSVLAHMKLYYQWRFHRIARDAKDRKARRRTQDEDFLGEFRPGWKLEAAKLDKETEAQRRKFGDHAYRAALMSNSHGANRMRNVIRDEERKTEAARHEYLSLKARLDTMPSSDGSFLDCLKLYDDQLLDDVRLIQRFADLEGSKRLRPHYEAMLWAYEAEQRGRGLNDAEVIEFFDTYVHDSLAAFAMDATLPSDPRVIYIGRDAKLRYAQRQPRQRGLANSALG